jgi:hypothetical protein
MAETSTRFSLPRTSRIVFVLRSYSNSSSNSEFFIACPGSICEGPQSNKLALIGLKPWAESYSPFFGATARLDQRGQCGNALGESKRPLRPDTHTLLLKAADQRFPSPAGRCPGGKHELPGNNRKPPDQQMHHGEARRRSRQTDQQKSRTPFRFALRSVHK